MFDLYDPLQEFILANAARRRTDPDLSPASATLLCTPDGIFLWPGTPLLTKSGGRFAVRPRDRIYDLVCRLHGPRAAWTPLLSVLERATDLLNQADIGAARKCVGRLTLPPVDQAGFDLMRAIAKRRGIEPLACPIATNGGTGLRPDLAIGLAEAYDAVEPSWAMRKVGAASDFNATHPRLEGPPNAGWFATSVSDSTGERRAPSGKAAATLAQIDTALKHPNVKAFLDVLSQSEGSQYDTMYGGGRFGDYSTFPGKKPHSPSGRYQITQDAYERLSQKLELSDFSPSTQDRMAVQLIAENKALEPLLAGRLDEVIPRLTGIWSSLPNSSDENGGSYRPFRSYEQVRRAFDLNLLKYPHQ